MAQVRRVAPTSATVLITGESGTGKELTAAEIHRLSGRSGRPLIPVNCGAISPQLIESELFGHEKGSFTGAVRSHRGLFEQAEGGTLFLDEITEMPKDLQVKLLRVLESHRYVPVGGDQQRETDVRIIAATNQCPEEALAAGRLREDLFYRLQVFPIELPPLREHREDIPDLAFQFLDELNSAEGQAISLSDEALRRLGDYSWPGNVRELKNVLQRAFILADTTITEKELPLEMIRDRSTRVRQKGQTLTVDIGSSVAEVEKNLIIATLRECDGRREQTARILGVSMKTLYNRLRKYGEPESVRHIGD